MPPYANFKGRPLGLLDLTQMTLTFSDLLQNSFDVSDLSNDYRRICLQNVIEEIYAETAFTNKTSAFA
jgi:hypothetical protein